MQPHSNFSPTLDAFDLQEMELRNREFWKTLHAFIPKTARKPTAEDPFYILSVGCGESEETRTVCSFFSTGIFDIPSQLVKFYGIDSDEYKLAEAKYLAALPTYSSDQPFTIHPECTFMIADASRLSQISNLPTQFDFALLRHHFLADDILQEKTTWIKIFDQTLAKLKPDGIVMATSYKEAEAELLKTLLRQLPVNIERHEKNPHHIPLGPQYPGVAYDKWVTILRKNR